ncbi:MAG TPA: GNAT family N-acetyltransferase [Verrucomicrobiae bacterium]|jgi:RimJ/RimL family protein N-acetyltransferase|nr:GNAT family N-acetyltransferase [Verrucomicrobiae bacterium]
MSDVFNLSEPIVTERLELTPLRVADADAMVDVLADPALHAFIGGDPPTRDDLVARYRAQTAGPAPGGGETWRNWIVREQPSLRPIGFVQATIQDAGDGTGGSAEIAWVIGTAWQGRGYATEAARALVARLESAGIRSIVAHVHPDHVASATVAERAGLVPTGQVVDGERVWRRIVSEPGASGLGSATRR